MGLGFSWCLRQEFLGLSPTVGQGLAQGSLFFPRDCPSDDDNTRKQHPQSSDESFEPYPEKKVSGKKSESKEGKKTEEPKIRKKPGPKPGWKKKLRPEREELPTIYKCPYQGCTAVYRGADGMKVRRGQPVSV